MDADGDGRVDSFRDVVGEPDGLDDGSRTFPYQPVDENGNGVFDHIDTGTSAEQSAGDDQARAASPLTPDQLADGDTGVVRTGLNAAGCSIVGGGHPSANNFWLLLVLLVAVRFLAQRLFRVSK